MNMPVAERRTLENMWRDLERRIFSVPVSSVQRREMRRAFYAGAAAWADLMLHGLDGQPGDGDHDPTAQDLEYVSQLHDELKAFGDAIQAGMA